MSNRIRVTICAVLLFITVIASVLIIGLDIAKNTDSADINETSGVEYVLKDYDGRLAVFKSGLDKPEMVFDVFVKNLPQYDQTALQKGIAAKDIEELNRLIEDYIS